MDDITPYLFLYSANLVFIVTNFYGWILKTFFRAEPYRDNFDNLFPSQRAVAALYLLQIFEIPYLLMIGEPKALFYVNAFSILFFSSLMVVMCDGYFFRKRIKIWPTLCYFLPVALIVIYLLLAAMELVPATKSTYRVMFWVITPVFLYYIVRLILVKQNIRQSIRAFDEESYSNSDDFPVRFARRIEWVPIAICVLMFICFVLNDARVKMWRDLFFTFVNVWFLLYTLNPHRKGIKPEEELKQRFVGRVDPTAKYKLSKKRCKEIEHNLIAWMEKEKPFRQPPHSGPIISKIGCKPELYQRGCIPKQAWILLHLDKQLSDRVCPRNVAARPNTENRTRCARFGLLLGECIFTSIQTLLRNISKHIC